MIGWLAGLAVTSALHTRPIPSHQWNSPLWPAHTLPLHTPALVTTANPGAAAAIAAPVVTWRLFRWFFHDRERERESLSERMEERKKDCTEGRKPGKSAIKWKSKKREKYTNDSYKEDTREG